jgi:hypothetical protein
LVEPAEGHSIKLNIFVITKLLTCAVGTVKNAKKLQSGAVLIEVANYHQAKSAMNMTLGGHPDQGIGT